VIMARPPRLSDEELAEFVVALVHHCVRNPLERFHGGPDSRIGDLDMKDLMIEIVNKVFTVLHDETFVTMILATRPRHWNSPELDHDFMQWKAVRLGTNRRPVSELVFYNAAASQSHKPAWRIDVAASLRKLGLSQKQILDGHWSEASDERRLQAAILTRQRWAKER
jgi:hypothetical protein